MSRAYVVYFVMFAALIAGMVLIMTMGESVRAPDDLSGEWVVEWDNAPPPESGEPVMRVAQSGRFFVVTFGQRPPMSMKLQDGWTGKTKGRKLHMRLARPPWELRLDGDIPPKQRWQLPEMNLELVGPTRHVGIARRVYPETAENAPEPSPAPEPAPAPAPAPAEAVEPAEAAAAAATAAAAIKLPTTNPTPTEPAASAVPSETAHAR
jgi:hypothetical protein